MSALIPRFELHLAFEPSLRYDSLSGARGFSRLTGGRLVGPDIEAELLCDGGDHELIRRDGILELEGRYVARSDDGIVLYLQNRGYLHPDRSLRCTPRIETPPGRLEWLSRALLVGVGERQATSATIRCFEVR